MSDLTVSQGTFRIKKQDSGAILFNCPPTFIVAPQHAVEIAMAILREAGVDTVMAHPGQIVAVPKKGLSC